MTVRAVTYYEAVCDYPDCGNVDNQGEYTAWGDPATAVEMAVGSDWTSDVAEDGKESIYCSQHRAFDEERDEDGVLLPNGRWIVA